MLDSLHEEFGIAIAPEAFRSEPTIEGLAQLVRTGLRVRGSRPTPIRMPPFSDGDLPLVFPHSVSGELNYLQRLPRSEIGRSTVGLRAPGLDLEEEPYTDLEALADRHVSDLLAAGIDEPFALAGFSAGALIAYAMACQLLAAGRTVAYLGLFEPPPADGSLEMLSVPEFVDERLRELCFFNEIDADPSRPDECLRALQEVGGVPPGYSQDLFQRVLEVYAKLTRAQRAYVPDYAYEGRAVLYESRDYGCGDIPTGRLSEAADSGPAYERSWLEHLRPDTLVRRQRCPHRSLHHTADTRRFLRDDVSEALSDLVSR
jgi:thioesterase domain-containing protein